ncbi:predicted cytochrome C biogenesis protein transmembrane region [Paracholeplasma brassicae]|uniref:Predicted cytochrome C biogenesis protein transmembrane region n=1 Tax=Acholeplasma brassicae TaxID=61635 RepID=U4KMC7_9MOLU|nr:cytochrome C biogenesis protein region [Paracholeplasma brassicae]CCV65191.1 predicted cytochrome C biogenesis protein transmembrane region [Paracholeplasma brassicae]
MKRFSLLLFMLAFVFSQFQPVVKADDYDVVYFGSKLCSGCQEVEASGVFDELEAQGLNVKKYILEDDSSYTGIFRNYQYTYGVKDSEKAVPILFVGDTFVNGVENIKKMTLNEEIKTLAQTPMLPIEEAPAGGIQIVYLMLLGLLDGINPCAIAMLIIFISLLGFSKEKKVLLKVSITFMSAIFISYFLFGTILFRFLSVFAHLGFLVTVVPYVILGISVVLFLLNFYDYLVTRKQQYDKVKNQLPKGIQRFNRNLMKKFTDAMENDSIYMYVITFVLGLIISVTEFLCTGQAYLTAILHLIHFSDHVMRGILLLFMYNILFILPLIIITVIAVKTKSVMGVTVFMREKLHIVKLINAIVFLAIGIYYIFVIIG